jgi:hypothetical protein
VVLPLSFKAAWSQLWLWNQTFYYKKDGFCEKLAQIGNNLEISMSRTRQRELLRGFWASESELTSLHSPFCSVIEGCTACRNLICDSVEKCHYFHFQHNCGVIQFPSNRAFGMKRIDQLFTKIKTQFLWFYSTTIRLCASLLPGPEFFLEGSD